MDKEILVCGIGGQGTVLASKLISQCALDCGEIVHSAETIGMAQRGGSVTSHVRIGKNAYSPLIPKGKADVILAFESAEAVRNLEYLKKDGTIIVNLNDSNPKANEMIEYLKTKCQNLIIVNDQKLCQSVGTTKVCNVAILGVACKNNLLGLNSQNMLKTIQNKVPPKFIEINLQAFELGQNY